jgi:hypothetical protein
MSYYRLLRRALTTACLASLPFCYSPTESDNNIPPDPISFSDLQVGQSSSYLSFAVSGYWSGDKILEYTYDTLVVTITAEQQGGFLVTERFVDVDTTDWWHADDTVTYLLQVSADTLLYWETNPSYAGSRLFGWYSELDLPLTLATETEVTLDGWQSVFPTGECCLGGLDSFAAFGQSYGPLNVLLIDMTAVDGPAQWWLYSATHSMVRYMFINAWTGTGKGWDLLP